MGHHLGSDSGRSSSLLWLKEEGIIPFKFFILLFITRWVNTPLLAMVQRVITENPLGNSRNTLQLAAVGIASFRIFVFIFLKNLS